MRSCQVPSMQWCMYFIFLLYFLIFGCFYNQFNFSDIFSSTVALQIIFNCYKMTFSCLQKLLASKTSKKSWSCYIWTRKNIFKWKKLFKLIYFECKFIPNKFLHFGSHVSPIFSFKLVNICNMHCQPHY